MNIPEIKGENSFIFLKVEFDKLESNLLKAQIEEGEILEWSL